MFRKLVSNLPFSPQLINQVSFYAKRLTRENITRRLAVVFAVLALVAQFFAVIAPPQSSTAASSNDLIYGGLRAASAKSDLLAYYDQGGDFAGHTDIKKVFNYFGLTRDMLANTQLTTINSNDSRLHSVGRNAHSNLDEQVPISGSTIFIRPLSSWGAGQTYRALMGHNAFGVEFFVMLDCGNIVVPYKPSDFPAPKPPPPAPPKPTPSNPKPKPQPSFDCTELQLVNLTKSPAAPNGGTAEFRGNGAAFNTTIQSYLFDFGDGTSKEVPSSATDVKTSHTYTKPGTYTAKLRVKTAAGTTADKTICQKTFTIGQLIPEKQVRNTSRPTSDPASVNANNTTAKAGETLEYSISQRNSGSQTEKDYVFSENLNDVLEYADVTEPGGGNLSNNTLTWAKQDIKSGDTVTKKFKVKIKDPVPATPAARSDPQSFDGCMDNVFEGKNTRVCVNIPVPKVIEQASQQLPNTGPGLDIALGTGFAAIVAYFFFRNRQLIKELTILRKEYNGGGNV
jgi:uncharacterized repeat protein (TIGR01451 family)